MHSPFIPSHSRVCETANLVMMFSVTVAGLIAAVTALVIQVAG
ncbi:hypothetical protein [Rhizobium ruizarguesonis]|nr:hypothetical protein [Rhizobium ruizarguesonis]WSH69787.1 hypothetical protein U8Q05_37100 [Rhizobium ruizarguesonis]